MKSDSELRKALEDLLEELFTVSKEGRMKERKK
jgi:hypothetical protein